jgi:GMP synthase-like glutamine amidotransferase
VLSALARAGVPYCLVRTPADLLAVPADRVAGLIITGSSLSLTQRIELRDVAAALLALTRFGDRVPVLGVCFGCQLLHVLHGGRLTRLDRRMRGPKPVELESACRLFRGVPPRARMVFACKDVPSTAVGRVVATVRMEPRGPIHQPHHQLQPQLLPCAFEYVPGRVYGCLFHPEGRRETEDVLLSLWPALATSP